MKKLLFVSLILILLMSCFTSAEAPVPLFRLGDKMEDFSVVTADGETFTLSEALREKDMVLIDKVQ